MIGKKLGDILRRKKSVFRAVGEQGSLISGKSEEKQKLG